MAFKIRFLLPILFISLFSQAQTKDSLALATQTFKINDSVEYTYPKPKFFDLFRYIPSDLVGFGKFTIQKENLKWDALAIGSTLAIIPYDQKILEDSGELGHRIGGWDELSHLALRRHPPGTGAQVPGGLASPMRVPGMDYRPFTFVVDELPLVIAAVCSTVAGAGP